jgi:voltage-gated sodium channel
LPCEYFAAPALARKAVVSISGFMKTKALPPPSKLQARVLALISAPWFTGGILAVIMFNALVLGLETSPQVMAAAGPAIELLDQLCLAIFVLELLLKIFALRRGYFRDGWNLFDFTIVAISLVPGAGGLSVLRAMRILRLLRVVSVAPTLRRVVEGLLNALPGMGSVFLLMGVIFYIGAVMATKLFGAAFPDWFGTLGRSAYTLFQIMTLESWSMGIVRPVMEVFPYAWAFFVPFILVTTFAVVNLVVGLMVNSMQDAHQAEANAQTVNYRDDVLTRLADIEAALKQIADQRRD